MAGRNWKRGFLAAVTLILFGIVVLPALIYLVGAQVFGEYEGSDGVMSLYAAIFAALAEGSLATWLLVLSPVLVIALVRIAAALHRLRRPVNSVTD